LLVSAVALQFRYILKKENVGEDILDILHDAFIETADRIDSLASLDKQSFRAASLLAVLRARTRRQTSMRRQVQGSFGINHREATNAVLTFDLDSIDEGFVAVEDVACVRGKTPKNIEVIKDVMTFLSTRDVVADDRLQCESHEDRVIASVDGRHLPEILARALDDRAQDIMRRRWLTTDPVDLEILSEKWGISIERVRQIERESLVDIRRHLEGKETSKDAAQLREKLIRERRRKALPRRMRTDRQAVKGVNLNAARKSLKKILPPLVVEILNARYFMSDIVPTFREVCEDMDVSVSAACLLENNAMRILRDHYPALSAAS